VAAVPATILKKLRRLILSSPPDITAYELATLGSMHEDSSGTPGRGTHPVAGRLAGAGMAIALRGGGAAFHKCKIDLICANIGGALRERKRKRLETSMPASCAARTRSIS
jgi:hypothetical protein